MTDNTDKHEPPAPFLIAAMLGNAEFLVAAVFCACGAFVAIFCWFTLKFFASYGPGPGFAPVLTGIALALVAGGRALSLLRAGGQAGLTFAYDPRKLQSTALLIVLSFLTIPLMDWIGSTVALTILAFVMMWWIQRETFLMSFFTALIMPAVLVWLFRTPLSIPLPRGLFF